MKRLTQLINESSVNYDTVEDVMIHLEDMGFKIKTFNDLGGLFGPGHFDDTYHKMNSYARKPTKIDCYPVYIISLVKKFNPFSDCELYGQVIREAETVKRRLNTCQVYYRLDTTSIQGATIDGGLYGDTEKNLQVTFHITDKSYKISDKSLSERKLIEDWLVLVVKSCQITNIYSLKWGIDDISIIISSHNGYMEEIKVALIALEMQENLDEVVSGYKITKSSYTWEFVGQERHSIIITYSPK